MLRSERGNTLVLVLGLVVVLGLLLIPLSGLLSTGMLHSATDGTTEAAFVQSESAAVIYKRLYAEAVANGNEMTEADARQLASGIASLGLYDRLAVDVTPATGMPEKIAFSSWSGNGPQQRGQTVELNMSYSEENGSGSGSTGEDVFYRKHAVITDKRNYDYLFTYCGVEPLNIEFFGKDYDRAKFTTEFNAYMDQYTGSKFDERFASRPMPLTPLKVPDTVKTISNVKTQQSAYIYTGNGGAGIQYAGDVELRETKNTPYTISPLSSDIAIQAAGNILIPAGDTKNVVINGNLITGGNFTVSKGEQLTINGDVRVRGDMSFDVFNEITINGNLIVNGNVSFNGSVKKVLVTGDVIIGGNLSFNSNISEAFIAYGTISTTKSMKFTTAKLVSAGKWTATGQAEGNDRNSIIVGDTFQFTKINQVRATGDLSSVQYNAYGQLNYLKLGGSFIAGGSAVFQSKVVEWNIQGSISIGQDLTVRSVNILSVGGSVYAANSLTLSDIGSFTVVGSLVSYGKINFSNTFNQIVVSGDIISANNIVNFDNRLFDLRVGGTIAAGSDIIFTNTVDKLGIGKDLIAKGSILFKNTLENSLVSGGMIAALANIEFANSVRSKPVQFGGFYAGGTMSIPEWAAGQKAICINYNPPSGTGSTTPTKKLVITADWSSRSYRRP